MAPKLDSKNSFEEFLQTPKIDRHFRLSISRNTLVAFIASLLIHALILVFVMPKFKQAPEVEPPPFQVVLAQPEQAETPPAPLPEILPQEPIPEPPAEPVKKAEPIKKPKVMTKPATKTPKPEDFSVPDVLATPKSAPDNLPTKPDDRKPDDKPVDMLAYVNKKRAERDAEEASAA